MIIRKDTSTASGDPEEELFPIRKLKDCSGNLIF